MKPENELGVYRTDGTFRSESEIKRDFAMQGDLPKFTTPLPTPENFDYWSERFRGRQEQYQETAEVRNQHVEISLPERSVINFIGDTHVGAPNTDYNRIAQEVEVIANTPNSYVMLMGDLVDGFFFNPAQMEQIEQAPEQFEYARSLIQYLGEKKKILVGWSGDHDCLDEETELLTKRGWISYTDIRRDDKVLSLTNNNNVTWTGFSHIIQEYFSGTLYKLSSDHIDLVCTGKHRFFYKERHTKNLKFQAVKNLVKKDNDSVMLPVAGVINNQGYNIEDRYLEIIGWFLSDGYVKRKQIVLCQSKQRGEKVRSMLKRLRFSHRESVRQRTRDNILGKIVGKLLPSYEFRLTSKDSQEILKMATKGSLSKWTQQLNKRQFDILLNALIDGDGSRQGKALMFYQKNKTIIDQLQALCVMFGYRTTIYEYVNRAGTKQYRLNICSRTTVRHGSYKKMSKKIKYDGVVWDLTVPKYHNFMVRRNGKAYFTGNSWVKKMGMSAYRHFAEEAGGHYINGVGFVTLNVGEQEYKLTGAHRMPGSSMYNKVHQNIRAEKFGAARGSDIIVSGHTHQKGYSLQGSAQFGGESQQVHYITIGPYKYSDDYARKLGLTPLSGPDLYGSSVMLHKDHKRVEYFDDILVANQALVDRL